MPIIRLRSVRQKLLLMVLVTNFLSLLTAGGALLYHDLMESRAKTAASLSALADVLAQGSATALEFDDPRVANENLAQLRANRDIVSGAVYTAKGRLFAKYMRDQVPDNEIPARPGADGFRFAGTELSVFRQVTSGQEVVGTVYLKERYELYAWLRDYLLILGVVLLVSLGLGTLISSRLQRWVSDPIRAVSSVARQVMEQRDYHLRATRSTEDEIGQLADAFNGMLQTLEYEITERSNAEQAVRTLNAGLEQRVAERTADLSQANARLSQSHGELQRLSAHLQRVREDERRHIARNIHDDLGASLTALQLDLTWMQKRLGGASELQRKLESMLETAAGAMEAVRHILHDLRPDVLDHLGLWAALEGLLQDFRLRSGIRCRYACHEDAEHVRLDTAAEMAIYRIVQEALTNVLRHAAASEVTLLAEVSGGRLQLSLQDNGRGMPLGRQPGSFGLLGMQERARILGGELIIDSIPGQGTCISLYLAVTQVAAGASA